MRGIKIGLAQFGVRLGIEPDGPHEAEGLGDVGREFLVAGRLRTVFDETEHPAMGVFEIGIAAGCKGTQQIQGCRRLPVSHELARRIGLARASNVMSLMMSPR